MISTVQASTIHSLASSALSLSPPSPSLSPPLHLYHSIPLCLLRQRINACACQTVYPWPIMIVGWHIHYAYRVYCYSKWCFIVLRSEKQYSIERDFFCCYSSAFVTIQYCGWFQFIVIPILLIIKSRKRTVEESQKNQFKFRLQK